MKLLIDRELLLTEIETLAGYSEAEAPAVTRIVFTATDMKARAWLVSRCEETGLQIRQDAIGNIFARWVGSDSAAPVVGTGSHIDAIPNAGKYDGVVGVLGGLEAIRALRRGGFRPKSSIELLVFTSEEPTRFGIGCLAAACCRALFRQKRQTLFPTATVTAWTKFGAERGFLENWAT